MKSILSILILIFSISSAFACSCTKNGIFKGQNNADFVFTGKVIGIREIITQEKLTGYDKIVDYKRFEFIFEINQIHKIKKGITFSDRISIITSGGGADCGNKFILNNKYLVYSHKQNHKIGWGLEDQKTEEEFMTTSLCTRTKKIGFFTFLEQFLLELT